MKKLRIPLTACLALLLLFICGRHVAASPVPGIETIETNQVTAQDGDKYGGTLVALYPYSPTSTPGWPGDTDNPQKLWMTWTVFEPLVRLDAAGKPQPWLATSWDWGASNSFITFNLRQGVMFHDGTPFSSEAVKIQAELLMAQMDGGTLNWDRWEIIDDLTIRLYLKKYLRDFWEGIAGWNFLFMSSEAYKTNGLSWMKEHPIGTGPFKFKSFERDDLLEFVRNENYWQAGKPYLDGIKMVTVKEPLTLQTMMENGQGDMSWLQSGKILQDFNRPGFNVVSSYVGTCFLIFDTTNEGAATNDPRIRIAIEYGLDKPSIVRAMGYGDLVVNNQIMPPGNPCFNTGLPSRRYNPERSRELLAEAGYGAGLSVRLTTDASGTALAVCLQQYLAAIGISLEIETVDTSRYWKCSMAGWDGILISRYATGINLASFIRGYFPPLGLTNISCEIPQDIQTMCASAMAAVDDGSFRALSDEVARMIYDRCLFLPVFSNAVGHILSQRVQGTGVMKYADWSVWDPADTWLAD